MWVRTLLFLAIIGLVSGAVVAQESPHEENCPEIIWSDGRLTRSGPLWVTAEKAVGPDGKIDWDFLGESAQVRHRTVLLRENDAKERRKSTEKRPSDHGEAGCLNYADSTLGGYGEDDRVFVADGFVLFPDNEEALPMPILETLLKPQKLSTPYEVDQLLLQVLSSSDDCREDR